MTKSAFIALLILVCITAFAQTPAPAQNYPQPKAEDVLSMDSIIKAVYDVISGPAGQKRDEDRLRSLFVNDARMGAAVRTRKGDIRYFGFSVEDYFNQSEPYFEKNGFYEREIHRHVDTFGNISAVFSTYESRNKPDDKTPFERGVNSFQLMNDGKRWWIVSIYWQGEDDKLKLPDEWLKG